MVVIEAWPIRAFRVAEGVKLHGRDNCTYNAQAVWVAHLGYALRRRQDILAREQILLVITYLQSLDMYAERPQG